MSVIVWDGKTLAADRMAVNGNLKRTCKKIYRHGDLLIGGAGTYSSIQALTAWVVEHKADIEKFPKIGDDADVVLWVVNRNGTMAKYESGPWPMFYEEETWADGSGRDFAYGALAMGADAVKAVEVASTYDAFCGRGCDALSFDD